MRVGDEAEMRVWMGVSASILCVLCEMEDSALEIIKI